MCGANTTGGLNLFLCPEYIITRNTVALVAVFFGLPLNSVTFYAIIRYEKPLNTQNTLVVNLILNNIAFAGVVLPAVVADMWLTLPGLLCSVLGGILILMWMNTIMAYLHITLHRYFTVVHAKSRRLTYGSPRKAIASVFGTSLVNIAYVLLPITGIVGAIHESPSTGTCTLIRSTGGVDAIFNRISLLGFNVLPIFIMAICYTHLFVVVRRKQRQITHHHQLTTAARTQQLRNQRTEMRLSMVAMGTVLAFILTLVPYFMATSVPAVYGVVVFNAISSGLSYLHAVSDPLIYVMGTRRLRHNIWRVLGRRVSEMAADKDALALSSSRESRTVTMTPHS